MTPLDKRASGAPDQAPYVEQFIDTAEGITLIEDPPNNLRGATDPEQRMRTEIGLLRAEVNRLREVVRDSAVKDVDGPAR